jgi:L-asparagine transporter-like permease
MEGSMADTMTVMPHHVEIAYKDAVDNIRFNKRQQWMTTNYAILIYAVIFLVSARFFSRTDFARGWLGVLAVLTFVCQLSMLKLFQDAIASYRLRLAWIYRSYFTPEERTGLNLSFEAKPYLHETVGLLGLVAVSAAGAAITLIYLFSVR